MNELIPKAAALLPPIEREERDEEEQTSAVISVQVLAIVRDGTYQIVRHIEETALERDGCYEWIGWVREPDDGTAEDVTHWMVLPEGPK